MDLAVGTIDIGKGLAAVLLAYWLLNWLVEQMLALFMGFIGYVGPVFIWVWGDCGAATPMGLVLATMPWVAVRMGVLAVMYILLPLVGFELRGYSYPLVFYS